MFKRLILCSCVLTVGCAVSTNSTRHKGEATTSGVAPATQVEPVPVDAASQPTSLPASVLARWDADADGVLNADERRAMQTRYLALARERRRKWELARFDRDKDGKLSDAEKAAMQAATPRPGRLDLETVKRWDADHDGRLSDEEARTMQAAADTERRKLYVEMWDANGDGRVDAEEARVAREYERTYRIRVVTPWVLQRYDSNNNRRLDPDERSKMKADERRDRRMRTRRGPRRRR